MPSRPKPRGGHRRWRGRRATWADQVSCVSSSSRLEQRALLQNRLLKVVRNFQRPSETGRHWRGSPPPNDGCGLIEAFAHLRDLARQISTSHVHGGLLVSHHTRSAAPGSRAKAEQFSGSFQRRPIIFGSAVISGRGRPYGFTRDGRLRGPSSYPWQGHPPIWRSFRCFA